MSETAADGAGPAGVVKNPFFLKTLGFVVVLVVVGLAAPSVFPDNEFVGVLVGMTWSLALLIVLVVVVAIVAAAVRQALG